MRFFQGHFSRAIEEYRNPKKLIGSMPAVIIALVISLAIGYRALGIFLKEREINHDIKTLEENIAKAKATNDYLDNEIGKTHSPETIERLAKEELNLQKPGERVAVIVPSATATSPQIQEKYSFWARLKNLILFR